MSKRKLSSRIHLAWLLPLFMAGLMLFACLHLRMSALAWARSITEPLVNNSRHGQANMKIRWGDDAIEIFDAASDIDGFESDIRVGWARLEAKNRLRGDILTYQPPRGPVLIEFTQLEVPREILNRILLGKELEAIGTDPLLFQGSMEVNVDEQGLVKIHRIFQLTESNSNTLVSEIGLGVAADQINQLLPKSTY